MEQNQEYSNAVTSRIFDVLNWPTEWLENSCIDEEDCFIMQIKISELPKDSFSKNQGMLYIFINESNDTCKVFFYPKEDGLKQCDITEKGHPIKFSDAEDTYDGTRLFGKPIDLQGHINTKKKLLFLFDPYDFDTSPVYESLDGYIFFFINEKDFNQLNFNHIEMVKSYT